MSDPVLESQDARDQGLAPPALDPDALGGLWLNVGLPQILRDIAAFVFLPLIVVVIAVDVVGRYFFSHPFQWSQEIATLALLLLVRGRDSLHHGIERPRAHRNAV